MKGLFIFFHTCVGLLLQTVRINWSCIVFKNHDSFVVLHFVSLYQYVCISQSRVLIQCCRSFLFIIYWDLILLSLIFKKLGTMARQHCLNDMIIKSYCKICELELPLIFEVFYLPHLFMLPYVGNLDMPVFLHELFVMLTNLGICVLQEKQLQIQLNNLYIITQQVSGRIRVQIHGV